MAVSDTEEHTPSETTVTARSWGHTFRALRHRNFRLFMSGQIVSVAGTFMQSTAQSWLVYRLTHSEFLLGTCWFCSQIAVFALGPLGGLAADRYSRHRLAILTQSAAMLQALILAALTFSGRVETWHILLLACVLGAINAFDMPVRQSLIIQMTSKDDLLNAVSLNSAAVNVSRVVGPGIAGMVVATVGEGACFLLNGLSFLAVIGSLLTMRIQPAAMGSPDSPWRHLMDGFRYAARDRQIRRVLTLMAIATLAGMPLLVLMPVFAADIFGRGSEALGALMGAMGLGAVIGSLGLARETRISGLPRDMVLSGFAVGAAYLTFALSSSFALSLAVMPVMGFGIMRQLASANTTIQLQISEAYRGRMMALYSMAVVGLGPFGSLISGALAGALGARTTVALGAATAMAGALWFFWTLKAPPAQSAG